MFSRTGGSNYHTFGDYLIQLSLSAKQFFFCDDKIDVKSIGYGGTYEWKLVSVLLTLCVFGSFQTPYWSVLDFWNL